MNKNIKQNHFDKFFQNFRNKKWKMVNQSIVSLQDKKVIASELLLRVELEDNFFDNEDIFPDITYDKRFSEVTLGILQVLKNKIKLNNELEGIYFINVVPTDFQLKEFIEEISVLCKEFKEKGSLLGIELSETFSGKQLRSVKIHLDRLKKDGLVIALDDFGKGNLNVKDLEPIPINFIKVDKSLCTSEDLSKSRPLKEVVEYCKKNNISLVAEGIESEEQMRRVIEIGFNYAQGYFFDLPN